MRAHMEPIRAALTIALLAVVGARVDAALLRHTSNADTSVHLSHIAPAVAVTAATVKSAHLGVQP